MQQYLKPLDHRMTTRHLKKERDSNSLCSLTVTVFKCEARDTVFNVKISRVYCSLEPPLMKGTS